MVYGYERGRTQEDRENLTPEEPVFLAAFLKHLARVDDPAYQEELARLNGEIEVENNSHFPKLLECTRR